VPSEICYAAIPHDLDRLTLTEGEYRYEISKQGGIDYWSR